MLDHLDDAADHTPVIDTWHAMRQWKMRSNPSHLVVAQQKKTAQQSLLERDSESHSLAD